MSAPDVQSVLCVGSSETSNNRDIGLNLSPSFSRKYANYTPWPTPCDVVSWPPKTVPVFVDQWSGKEWHGNGIRMRTH